MEEHEKQEFSDSDKAVLREIAKEKEHRRWLTQLLKAWAQWIVAVVLGFTAGKQVLAELITFLAKDK